MTNFVQISNYFGIAISLIFLLMFLFINGKINKSKFIGIIGMAFFAVSFSLNVLIILNRWNLTNVFAFIYLTLLFSLYPLIYHYILNLLNKKNKIIIEKNKFIFPILLLFLSLITHHYLDSSWLTAFITNDFMVSETKSHTVNYISLFFIISYYLQGGYFIHRFIRSQQQLNSKSSATGTSHYLQRWIKYIISGIMLFETTYIALSLFFTRYSEANVVVSLLFVIFLGIIGIKHNEILLEMKLSNGFHKKNSIRKRPSNIDSKEIANILSNMDKIILEEKFFLDPGLKLKNLARKIHIPEKDLSILINDYFKKNFTTYINDFRIEEAKKIIRQEKENCKLDTLYATVGFFSRSTFNRVFKSTTQITPREYLKKINQ